MSLFSKLVEEISFEQSLEKNSMHQIYTTLNGTGKELLPKTVKIFIFGVIAWVVCLFSSNNWFLFPIIASIIILATVIAYFKSSLYFKAALYNVAMYLFTQTALIFYLSSVEISENVIINRVIIFFYMVAGYTLSFYVIRLKLLEIIQTRYLAIDEERLKKRGPIKLVRTLSIILVSFMIVAIAGMQLYRVNKWWLSGSDPDFLVGLNGTFMGTILSVVLIGVAIIIVLLITLLPTLLLNATTVVDGCIYKKYSEDFRKEYEFTEKEWYGEK